VRRERLSGAWSSDTSKLTLISAPPGFGKTTLLAAWLASVSDDLVPVWVSLDPADNESGTFWVSVATALSRAAPTASETIAILEGSQSPPIETVVTTFANELGSVGSDVVLVLDDFHLIDASDVLDQVSLLLERLPPSAHVAITTRADPALPLARLRAQGQLVEIRAADLRFTRDEAAEYLNDAGDLDLDSNQIAVLEERTEGWIAALQLAALSIKAATTSMTSSRVSLETIASSSTTSPRKCWSDKPRTCADSSYGPASSIGSPGPVRCGHRTGRRPERARGPRSTELFLIPLDARRSGTDTTTCSPMSSGHASRARSRPRP
jgi:ATP/maltotriose-dependent transcriptional regulator MalT